MPPTSAESDLHPPAHVHRHVGRAHGRGFWLIGFAFLVSMAFSVVPTPLWSLYQQRDGFSTFVISIAFAAYAVGVLLSLFFVGHISDRVGRRRILLIAILLEVIAAVGFILWNDLAGLITARIVSGLGIGMITATSTAWILELHTVARPGHDRTRSDLVSTAANLGGFGVGALVSGLLAQWAPAPLLTPYLVFVVLLVLAGIGVAATPETVMPSSAPYAYRPQRVRVPHSERVPYLAAATVAFAAFAVLGLFTSLAPVFMSAELGVTSRATIGFVVFVTYLVAAVSQMVTQALAVRRRLVLGLGISIAGIAALALGVMLVLLPAFIIGGILAGAGSGILLRVAIASGSSLAEPRHRGEALAGIFLAGYLGLSVPVLGLGIATLAVTLQAAMSVFAVLASIVITIGSVTLARRL